MSGPADPSVAVSPGLVEAALENLVNQFARPLECLRELVQNAIDAGSPRVTVTVGFVPPAAPGAPGELSIAVADTGEGMDEATIDDRLTRIFASGKEDDLTKIGRFGIGFTSIFAIQPTLVQVRTGRLGAGWELVFHPDRSFDKLRLDRPQRGTTVTLFKRIPPEDRARWVEECRAVLAFWCAHSTVPIWFVDATLPRAAPAPAPAPAPALAGPEAGDAEPAGLVDFGAFAAFGDPALAGAAPAADADRPGVCLSAPLGLDAPLVHCRREGGVEAWVGFGRPPRFGWYNGGLTLLSTRATDCLGPRADRLAHLCIKVKSDRLEHTLTRDNIVQDAHWKDVLGVIARAADALATRALALLGGDGLDPAEVDGLLGYLAAELAAGGLSRRRLRRDLRLPARDGSLHPFIALEGARARDGAWLLAGADPALDEVLASRGRTLLRPGEGLRALLGAWEGEEDRVRASDSLWRRPVPLAAEDHRPVEQRVLGLVATLLGGCGLALQPTLGQLGGGRLAWVGTEDDGLLRISGAVDPGFWDGLRARLGRQERLWIDQEHPLWAGWCALAPTAPALAAFAVCQVILADCGLAGGGRTAALERCLADQLSGARA